MKLRENQRAALGSFLSGSRKAAGLTQAQAAKRMRGVSNQYISNIERGLCVPSPKFVRAALRTYKIPRAEFTEFYLDLMLDVIHHNLKGIN